MALNLEGAFDQYPSPVFIVKPLMENGTSYDFKYLYANQAFAEFLDITKDKLIGHNFQYCFGSGEQDWLDRIARTARENTHFFVNEISYVVGRKLYAEFFHIEPDLCGCIIHDFQEIREELESKENENAALRQKAKCDCLTGFYNRFYLEELKEKITYKKNVGISFVDINNLKVTNDTYGHDAGDNLILKVSGMLRSAYQTSDIFRIGGDEFVIITEDCEKDSFLKMAENAKKIFRKDNLAAIGYHFYDKLENLKASIDECDVLMYEDKRLMKGRI